MVFVVSVADPVAVTSRLSILLVTVALSIVDVRQRGDVKSHVSFNDSRSIVPATAARAAAATIDGATSGVGMCEVSVLELGRGTCVVDV